MPLPTDFSQACLQDYVDCRRRFQLRYLLKVAWPALESEPVMVNEQAMQQGSRFHRLIQQHLLGIPVERLTELAQGEDLSRWWHNYRIFSENPAGPLRSSGASTRPEITLSARLNDIRLIAKYDLLLVLPDGRIKIYDWKTSSRRPKRKWLLERLQTRVYPYLLVQAGAFLNQQTSLADKSIVSTRPAIQPEQIEMIYWFAEYPNEPEKIVYNSSQYQQDEQYLKSLLAEIASLKEDEFDLTPDEDRCRFCTYRSLCERGVEAGNLNDIVDNELSPDDISTALTSDFDFEHIAEISF